jgi:hypothetical protein
MNPLVVQGAAQLLLGKYKSQKGMFMKNMLGMAATGLVIFAGLGWYLDWYKVSRTTTPDGKQHISIDLNTKRIQTDIEKGKSQVSGYLQNGTGFTPSPTPPQQPYPNQAFPTQPQYPQGYAPQQPPYQQPGYQQPQFQQPTFQQPTYQQPPQGWIPAQPTSRPTNGFFQGQPGTVQPPSGIPGRPF